MDTFDGTLHLLSECLNLLDFDIPQSAFYPMQSTWLGTNTPRYPIITTRMVKRHTFIPSLSFSRIWISRFFLAT